MKIFGIMITKNGDHDPNDALESTPRMGIMIPMMPSYPSPGWGSLIPKMSI
jgi:hypothetical protein